jgi:hypothetical protein
LVKVCQASAAKASCGPSRCVLSRTATAFRGCLQISHGGLAVEIGDDEPAEQACVGVAGWHDLDGCPRIFGQLGEAI